MQVAPGVQSRCFTQLCGHVQNVVASGRIALLSVFVWKCVCVSEQGLVPLHAGQIDFWKHCGGGHLSVSVCVEMCMCKQRMSGAFARRPP